MLEDSNTHVGPRPGASVRAGRPYLMIIAGLRVGELHKLTDERTIVGRGQSSQVRLDDDGISREHAELVVAGGRLRVSDLGSTNGTYVNGERVDGRELRDGDKLSIGTVTFLVFTHDDGIERAFVDGRSRAGLRDKATSALRRDVFVERLAEEISFARRHAAPLALLVFKIDAFGATEDRHGKAIMRPMLAAVARRARGALHEDDVLAVFGPGRFAVACRETTQEEALARGEALRAAIVSAPIEVGTSRVPVTVSIGVAMGTAGSDRSAAAADALVREAEGAVSAARSRGGDRVELATSTANS